MTTPAYARRDYSGTAVTTTLNGGIGAGDTTIVLTASTGWPAGSNGPFVMQIEDELIDCLSRTGTTVTVVTGGRGFNGTSAATHSSGVAVAHVHSAYEANENNYTTSETIGKVTGAGQLLIGDGANSMAALDAKTAGRIIVGNGTTAASVAMSGDATIDSAGVVTIGASKITSAMITDGTIVNADVSASAAIALSKLATDPLARANHTGTQLSTTISDFTEASQDVLGALAAGGSGLTLTYNDGANTYVLDVNVDSSSIEINADTLRVKAAGITQAMHAAGTLPTLVQTTAPSGTAGQLWFDSDDFLLYVHNGTSQICITPKSATVATSQTTASTSYADLATSGPAVTIITGTKALVTVTANISNTNASATYMGYAVSSATTLAAADETAVALGNGTGTASGQFSATYLVTGLTAGSNIFTAKYRCSAGTATFVNRNITVVGLP